MQYTRLRNICHVADPSEILTLRLIRKLEMYTLKFLVAGWVIASETYLTIYDNPSMEEHLT
jgi:hypothetical protein